MTIRGIPVLLLLAGACLCAAAGFVVLRSGGGGAAHARNAKSLDSKIVIFAPPRRPAPSAIASAVAEVERAAGGAPIEYYDLRETGIISIRERLRLAGRGADFILGGDGVGDGVEWGAETAEARRIPIAAQPAENYTLNSVRHAGLAPGGRAFRVSCEGRALDPEKLIITIDGVLVKKVKTERHDADHLDVVFEPPAGGRHLLEIAASASEPPIRAAFETGDAPIIYISNASRFVAKALTAQGFQVKPLEMYNLSDASMVIVNSADFNIDHVSRAIAGDRGCLFIGEAALSRALASPELAPWIPATVKPRPPATPEAPPDDAPTAEDVAPPPDDDVTDPPAPETPEIKNPTPAAGPPQLTKAEYRAPVVALALVIDRSGSMTGEKMKLAKQSAIATAEILAADDYISIITFSDQSRIEYRADITGSPDKIRAVLNRISPPDGGTFFYPALVDAVNQLRAVNAAVKHIVLITDGATADRFTADYAGLIRNVLKPAGVTLSTVFTVGGGEDDPQFCGLLAKWGGGRSYPAAADQIPAVVSVEVRRVAGVPEGGSRRAAPGPPPEDASKKPPAPDITKKPPVNPDVNNNNSKNNNKNNKKKNDPPKPADRPKPPAPRMAKPAAVPGNLLTDGMDFRDIAPVRDFCELESVAGAAVALATGEPPSALLTFHGTDGGAVAALGLEDSNDGLGAWARDPRLRELLARCADALSRPSVPSAEKQTLEAVASDGTLLTKGTDALHLLDITKTNAEQEWSGSVIKLATGEWRSSLRVVPRSRALADDESALARLRARRAAPEKMYPLDALPERAPEPAGRAEMWLAGAVAFALAAAVAGRRSR